MLKRPVIYILTACLVGFCGVSVGLCDQTPDKMNIKRRIDVVKIRGIDIPLLLGVPVDLIRVFAYKNDAFLPIPFQIDEKDVKDEYIMPGDQNVKKPDYKIISYNDELVLMASDLGDKWVRGGGPPDYLRGIQIEVRDPVDNARGWAYVFSFLNPPQTASTDYVRFDESELMVKTDNYRLRFYRHVPAFPDIMAIENKGRGDNRNILDKLKLHFWGHLKFGFDLEKDEDDIIAYRTGLKDGLIRVVYQCETRINIFWKFKSWPFPQRSFFYRDWFYFPVSIEIPFDADMWLKSAYLRVGISFNPNAKGIKAYNDLNLKGVVIDGKMSPAEKNLDMRAFKWVVLASGDPQYPGSWLYSMNLNVGDFDPRFFYQDGPTAAIPRIPEKPAEFFTSGYIISGLEKMKKGRLNFQVILVHLPDFSLGKQEVFLQMQNQPLTTKISHLHSGFSPKN